MLVTMNQLAIVVGSLTAIIISYFLAQYLPASVSWRYMFASMLLPVGVFAVLLWKMPETPRWLSQRLFNVPSGVFFLCAFVSFISFFFLMKMLPETKGKSLEEIGRSWNLV